MQLKNKRFAGIHEDGREKRETLRISGPAGQSWEKLWWLDEDDNFNRISYLRYWNIEETWYKKS